MAEDGNGLRAPIARRDETHAEELDGGAPRDHGVVVDAVAVQGQALRRSRRMEPRRRRAYRHEHRKRPCRPCSPDAQPVAAVGHALARLVVPVPAQRDPPHVAEARDLLHDRARRGSRSRPSAHPACPAGTRCARSSSGTCTWARRARARVPLDRRARQTARARESARGRASGSPRVRTSPSTRRGCTRRTWPVSRGTRSMRVVQHPPAPIHSVAGMSRRAFALAALACSLLAAGCGVDHHDIVASTVIPTPRTADVVGGKTGPEDTRSIRHVTVVVLDRLTSDPVAGATVTLGTTTATTDKDGVAIVSAAGPLALHHPGGSRRIRHPARTDPPAPDAPLRGRAHVAPRLVVAGVRRRPRTHAVARGHQPAAPPTPRLGPEAGRPHRVPARHRAGDRVRHDGTRHADGVRHRHGQGHLATPAERAHGGVAGRRGWTRVRRVVRGPDPRVRRARRPAPLAEGARRGRESRRRSSTDGSCSRPAMAGCARSTRRPGRRSG